ncbi:FkbM family methyltransferase [Campylobacter novaezeelandiae]|uniref:FkbM family methyltransferase n=1 Tax=Campylobacter novaezeelandiae TaxID=2267891 RepID=UPI0010380594|nr:FkbM family methyltransferase [Campylobacter novaezeelandiae]TBR79644.1 FkbM family methyltransferase [Campylobacter novaezeelandiae]
MKRYIFWLFYFLPIKKNKIVFISHSGGRFDCNPRAIFEELYKTKLKIKFIWILSDKFHEEYKYKYPRVTFVSPKSIKAFYHLSTCEVFINNQIHIFFKNMGFRKKPEQLYLQTWHGSFGMKHVPISDDIGTVREACADIDYWLTNSFTESNVYRKCFDPNARFSEIGHARSDFLFLNHNKNVHSYYGLDENVKIVLYAPTKRSNSFDIFQFDFQQIITTCQKKFDSDFILLIRLHRNLNIKINKEDKVLDAFDYPNVMELISECDILISDYSSIICDFALTYKPIFIYAKDYDEFKEELFYDYTTLPFGLSKTSVELKAHIEKFDLLVYQQKLKKWLESIGCIEDGNASKKTIRFIEQFITKDKSINPYTNYITPYIAKIMGFKNIYFTFRNIGDQIILMRALELLHQQTNEIFLVGTTLPELWKEVSFVKVVFLQEVKMHIYQKQQFKLLNNYGIKPIFLTQESFNKDKKGKFIRTYGLSHIVANVCSKLGLQGDVCVDLNLPLNEREKKFGRFVSKDKKQIAIISGGLQRYKTYPFEKLQSVVDNLYNEYNFVQIGTRSDLPLRNVLDLRGKLSLREVASTLYNSDLFIGGIGGLMHMANSVGCPSIVLYSEAEPVYMVNYNNNINVFPVNNSCKKCIEGFHCPWTSPCKKEGVKYTCIDNIEIKSILQAVNDRFSMSRNLNNPTVYNISSKKVYGLEEQKKVGFKFANPNLCFGYLKFKSEGKKVFQLIIFGKTPLSLLWKKFYIKVRIFNLHFSLKNFKFDFKIGKKKNNNDNLVFDKGSANFIKGFDQYYNRFLKLRNYLDEESLFLLNKLMQTKISLKYNKDKYLEPSLDEKVALVKRNEILNNYPIGKINFDTSPYSIYLYGQYISLIPVKNTYTLMHNCFIQEEIYKSYCLDYDIIDIGVGCGLSTLNFANYTNKKVYGIEPALNIYTLIEKQLKLNGEKNIIVHNLALGDKRQSVYVTNDFSNGNQTSLEKKIDSCFMETLDFFVKKNNIQPKLINIWTNGDEYKCLVGGEKIIEQFRPILHINISKSADLMFKILDFVTTKCRNYKFQIRKTIEPKITSELFIIAIPEEIKGDL